MTIPLALAALWAVSFLAFLAILLREVILPDFRRPPRLAPDPAFADKALADDELWAGIESEWHAFVDSLPERSA